MGAEGGRGGKRKRKTQTTAESIERREGSLGNFLFFTLFLISRFYHLVTKRKEIELFDNVRISVNERVRTKEKIFFLPFFCKSL